MIKPSFVASAVSKLSPRLCTLALCAATIASAQTQPPGQTTTTIGAVGVSQLKADLDGGGKAGWNSLGVNLNVAHQFTQALSIGVSAGCLKMDRARARAPSAASGRATR